MVVLGGINLSIPLVLNSSLSFLPAILNLKIPLISPAVKTADWYTKQAESLLKDILQCALAYFLYQPGNLFPGDHGKLRIAAFLQLKFALRLHIPTNCFNGNYSRFIRQGAELGQWHVGIPVGVLWTGADEAVSGQVGVGVGEGEADEQAIRGEDEVVDTRQAEGIVALAELAQEGIEVGAGF